MTDLQRLCDALNGTAIVLEERRLPLMGEAVRTAAEVLGRCYEILNFEGPDGRYCDELNQLAAKALGVGNINDKA